MDLAPHHATLRDLTRIAPDPRVRHRADGFVLVAGGMSLTEAAQAFGSARTSLRTGAARFLAEGRDGLADRGRRGRPPRSMPPPGTGSKRPSAGHRWTMTTP